MANSVLRDRDAEFGLGGMIASLAAIVFAIVASFTLGPDGMVSAIIASLAILVVGSRPHWGVAIIMTFLMVQYGSRRYERGGFAYYVENLIPAGSGLLTVNNVLGIFLLLVLVYRVYRDGDWGFLYNRQLQLVLLITLALVVSGAWNAVDYGEQAELGLRTRAQDPARLMFSRALFLLLFVSFIRRPNEIRLIAGIFVILAVVSAWSGASAAIAGAGRSEVGDYRGGGVDVLLEAAQNPNRLAMFATLGLIFVWTYLEENPLVRYKGLAFAAALLMIVTVFLAASRGGIVGLAVASALMFVRRRQKSRGIVYAVAGLVVAGMLVTQLVPERSLERITNLPGVTGDTADLEGSGSIERRQYTYGIGLKLWSQAPVLGVGLGNWSYMRFLIDPIRSAAAPHNAYLKALAEGGIVTLLLYLALFYVTLRQLNSIVAHPGAMAWARADGVDWLVHATRIGLVTFLVFSMFADLFDLIFFYLLIGLAASVIRRYFSGETPVTATA